MDWDNLVKSKFLEFTKKDSVYCDVGSCNGLFTSFFKDLIDENGHVYAFEPNPYNYESIKYLNEKNCRIENMAISNNIGELNLYADTEHSQNYKSNIIGYDVGFNYLPIIAKVQSTTLDDYFSDKKVDFIKIDVEGAELDVIKGGINTIKNSILTIIEVHFDRDWEELCNLLYSNNLQFFNLVDNSPITFYSEKPDYGRCYQIYYTNIQ
jgi:FkbM family methyltransferase